MDIEKCVINVLKQNTAKLNFHDERKEIGDRYILCSKDNFPMANIYTIMRIFKDIDNIDCQRTYIELHKHSVDSLWIFIGNCEDLTGLSVRINIDYEEKIIQSPAVIYLPKDTLHEYCPVHGSGYYFNIVLTGSRDYNAVTFGK